VEIHTVPGSKKWGYCIMGIGWDKTDMIRLWRMGFWTHQLWFWGGK
jgi:hypothetical protein